MWRWTRPRQRRPVHPARLDRTAWADLTQPDPDGRERAAVLATELRREAERLAEILGEPTVMLHDTVRVPGYLANSSEGDW